MAIVFLQKEKKQRNLILVFSAVILITVVVLWLGLSKKETSSTVDIASLLPKREVNINFDVLENPVLQSLQPFPEIEPFEESTTTQNIIGRENPFLPY
jgi:hypothetical protein